jgi:hypothetical protein
VWACVIARSGGLKSPALDCAVAPLRKAQDEAFAAYKLAHGAYEVEVLEYERQLALWKTAKSDDPPPEKPEKLTPERYIVSDTTVEALAPVLEANSRGVALIRDELSGWVRGFNQYKAGRGADAAAWLEMHRAGPITIDRKAGDKTVIHVPRAAVSVAGTIQPGVFASAFRGEGFESGLVARLLLAQPPQGGKRWTDQTPSDAILAAYENVIRELLRLRGDANGNAVKVPLSSEAKLAWVSFFNEHATLIAAADRDDMAAALAKLEGYAARLALIFTLIRDPAAAHVTGEAMGQGITLAEWFANETVRVYAALSGTEEDPERRELLAFIHGRGGAVTVRDVQMNVRRLRNSAADARAALGALVERGLGIWEHPAVGPHGGRPAEWFRLAESVNVNETPADAAKRRGSVDVDDADATGIDADQAPPEAHAALADAATTQAPGEVEEWVE